MKRRALITGCSGQDGSYMCDWLLAKDYDVYGMMRRSSTVNLWRIAHLLDRIHLIEGDMTDDSSLRRVLKAAQPDEIYHFAAQTHVGVSFLEPLHTTEVTALGTLRLLEAARLHAPHAHIYQASSSEMFGNASLQPQTEDTPLEPCSPYGCAKVYAHRIAQVYRQSYGMFIACGIAYNHESPRRSEEFVTRKITRSVALILAGQMDVLRLGNTAARRDWSHAKDIVRGAWLSLQHQVPDDFVFASGQAWSVQEFVETAFNYVGLEVDQYVKTDPGLLRPTDIQTLTGYSGKAQRILRWTPEISFMTLVKEMVDADCAALGLSHPLPSPRPSPSVPSVTVPPEADLPQGTA